MEIEKGIGPYMLGLLEANRRLLVTEELDEEYTNILAGKLIQLDCIEVKPIYLLIHCKGGSVPNTFYLKNVIDGLNSPVYGLVIGKASSMAVDLLQMCGKRMMLPYAELFCHFTRSGSFRVISNNDDFSMKDATAIRKWVLDSKKEREQMYAKRTGKTIKQVQGLFEQGEYFNISISAKDALKHKLIDQIVTNFKFFPGFKGRNYKGK